LPREKERDPQKVAKQAPFIQIDPGRKKQHALAGGRRRSPGQRPAVAWGMDVASSWLAATASWATTGHRAVGRPFVACCFVFFFCSFLLPFAVLAWLILLPTKLNETSKNPRDYIIV